MPMNISYTDDDGILLVGEGVVTGLGYRGIRKQRVQILNLASFKSRDNRADSYTSHFNGCF